MFMVNVFGIIVETKRADMHTPLLGSSLYELFTFYCIETAWALIDIHRSYTLGSSACEFGVRHWYLELTELLHV